MSPQQRRPAGRRIRAAAVALGAAAATTLGPLTFGTTTAAAAPAAPVDCARYAAAAAGDLVTVRVLDLRPLGLGLPPVTDLRLATTRAGFAAAAGQSAAQGRYVDGTVLGFRAPFGPLDATAYRLAPPVAEPVTVNPGRLDVGAARAGTGNLTATAAYGAPGRCDGAAGIGSESGSTLADAAVLPGRRTLVGLPDNLAVQSRTGLVRYRGGTAAEAVGSGGLADLRIFEALRVRSFNPVSLRVVAAGSAARSTVEYRSSVLAIDLPDGRTIQLDQANRSFDFSLPAEGTEPVPGMPMLPSNTLTELIGALPGGSALVPQLGGVLGKLGGLGATGAAAGSGSGSAAGGAGGTAPGGTAPGGTAPGGAATNVPDSAGSTSPPLVPGLPALDGIPAVGGLVGGVGRIATTPNQTALVLRLTGGELAKEVTDSGVHAKAISLRLKLLLVRGEGTTTLVDLCIGVLEAAATAPAAGEKGRGADGGYDGTEPDQPHPTAPTATPAGNAAGAEPTGSRRPTGKLPLTGYGVPTAVGAAVLLLLAGRFLMVVAKRRRLA